MGRPIVRAFWQFAVTMGRPIVTHHCKSHYQWKRTGNKGRRRGLFVRPCTAIPVALALVMLLTRGWQGRLPAICAFYKGGFLEVEMEIRIQREVKIAMEIEDRNRDWIWRWKMDRDRKE